VLLVTLHLGVVPVQAPVSVAVHATQMPSGSLQTGWLPEQSASFVQPVVQVSDDVLQMAVGALQVVLSMQGTQMCFVSSQTGVVPTHSPWSAAVHCTHLPVSAPLFTQAGASGAAHAAGVPEPRSPSQATQVPAALQIGVAPEHCAFELHWTHLFVPGSLQAGVGARQASRSPEVHWTQVPAFAPLVRQAGAVGEVQAWLAPEPRLPLQPTQVPLWQNGALGWVHCASMMHWTQRCCAPLQIGVGALQSAPVRHMTHWLSVVSHFGVGGRQFASVAQPRTH
jgi:hypothetical protein